MIEKKRKGERIRKDKGEQWKDKRKTGMEEGRKKENV